MFVWHWRIAAGGGLALALWLAVAVILLTLVRSSEAPSNGAAAKALPAPTVTPAVTPHVTSTPGLTPVATSTPVPTAIATSTSVPTTDLTPAPVPPAASVLRFVVKGDWGAGSSAQAAVTAAMCEWRDAWGFTYVLTTGDNFYGPDGVATDDNYFDSEECLYSYPQHRWRAAWGNHDNSASSTETVLGSPSQPKYYAWTAGGVAFFVYDGTEVSQAQRDWLRKAVCSSTAAVKVIYGHQSSYSTGRHGSDLAVREMVHPLARDCGVRLVLSGHDHLYERSMPIDGVTYIVSGGGGADTHSCKDRESWVALCLSRHHFLYIEVDAARLRVSALDRGLVVLDAIDIQY